VLLQELGREAGNNKGTSAGPLSAPHRSAPNQARTPSCRPVLLQELGREAGKNKDTCAGPPLSPPTRHAPPPAALCWCRSCGRRRAGTTMGDGTRPHSLMA